ncbi:MAG: helix-turn-helix transcriptional regulator [Clostridia bacterium]|nr:helix-turn-helix transcriptional regulator [Clostridia bacterium]
MAMQRHSVDTWIENSKIDVSIKNICGAVDVHWHEFYEIEIILSGEGVYTIDDTHYPIESGSVFIMSPASFHRPVFTKATKLINFMFTYDLCDPIPLLPLFEKNAHLAICVEAESLSFFSSLSRELIGCENNLSSGQVENYSFHLLNTLLNKITLLARPVNHQQETIKNTDFQKAILHIRNNFVKPLTLKEVSEISHYTPNYFNSLLKCHLGVTFKQYLIDLRLSFASNLLKTTSMSTVEIAFKSGFNDYANFMWLFKKKFQTTPKAFRQRHLTQSITN